MDKLEKQREKRKENGNLYTNRYEKTKGGFLMRKYRNIESRITGVQKKKKHLYFGKEILSRDEFYEFAYSSDEFHVMFDVWEKSNYDRKLTPTVDRKDSSKGYSLDNMRWLTHSENSSLGAISRFSKESHL